MNATTCLLLALLMPAADPNEDAKKDLQKMQGTWKVEKLTNNGTEAPAEIIAKMSVVIAKNKMTVEAEGRPGEVAEVTLDPSKKPAHYDFTPANDSKQRHGLYKFDGEKLYLCWTRGGGERPKAFESKPDSMIVVFELKKEKK
ncbi:MAG TPA: TIGR03067 domain-containing protein [Gemmataceae bacterium]|nr:TIGR03067 domain-containing protein [Gemmataceae bacterium]